ncbi:MAG: hypothetical protein HY517_04370 [Candidatus Aenigmarchaeota archaeon]|nr:hypothetical protein [Candidatus Aenigmarchaeota archaeon]
MPISRTDGRISISSPPVDIPLLDCDPPVVPPPDGALPLHCALHAPGFWHVPLEQGVELEQAGVMHWLLHNIFGAVQVPSGFGGTGAGDGEGGDGDGEEESINL